MKLDFVKLSPSQNMTLLVTTPVPREQHCAVAEQLMAYDSVHAEQVGFLESPSLEGARVRLQMMGGEFCGNATMSVGAFLAFQDGLADGESADYPLEVSGAEGIVPCHIRRANHAYQGTVSMPLPTALREITFPNGLCCPVVFFEGIAHAIVPADQMTRSEAEKSIAAWCEITKQEAFGILLREKEAMCPLVYVRSTHSTVWERGCGSGTAALGAYQAHLAQSSTSMNVPQPGGAIRVNVQYENGVRDIKITGTVKIAAIGQAWADPSSETIANN